VQFSLPFYNLLFFCSVTCFPNSQFDMGDLLIGTETTGNYTKLTAHAYHLDSGDISFLTDLVYMFVLWY
jgi:hypothetical protein